MSQRSEKVWEDFLKKGVLPKEELEGQAARAAAIAEEWANIKNLERLLKEARERWAGLLDECVHVKSDGTGAFSAQGCYDVCGVCGDAR